MQKNQHWLDIKANVVDCKVLVMVSCQLAEASLVSGGTNAFRSGPVFVSFANSFCPKRLVGQGADARQADRHVRQGG